MERGYKDTLRDGRLKEKTTTWGMECSISIDKCDICRTLFNHRLRQNRQTGSQQQKRQQKTKGWRGKNNGQYNDKEGVCSARVTHNGTVRRLGHCRRRTRTSSTSARQRKYSRDKDIKGRHQGGTHQQGVWAFGSRLEFLFWEDHLFHFFIASALHYTPDCQLLAEVSQWKIRLDRRDWSCLYAFSLSFFSSGRGEGLKRHYTLYRWRLVLGSDILRA